MLEKQITCRVWRRVQKSLSKILDLPESLDSSMSATTLLARLDKRRSDHWSEAVHNIDFLHSSQLALNIVNNMKTGPFQFLVLANAIATQIVLGSSKLKNYLSNK